MMRLVLLLALSALACAQAADDSRRMEIDADGGFVTNKRSTKHALGAHGNDPSSLLHERSPKKYSKEQLHHAHAVKTHHSHVHHDLEAQALLQSEQARR